MVNRGDSYANLPFYTSYDLAWLAPITYPLALSLVSIAFALREGYKAGYVRTTTNALATASVSIEAFFGILCFIQCVVNFSKREYAGGASACDFQAWYACFWLFSSIGLQPLVAYVSYQVSKTREQPSKMHVMVMAGAIVFVALVLSCLPIMGAGYYGFPKDYCMFELQDSVMGGTFLGVFFVSLLITGGYYIASTRSLSTSNGSGEISIEHAKAASTQHDSELNRMPSFRGMLTPKRLHILMFIWFLFIWAPTAIVVIMYQAGSREPPASSSESAWIAISLHSQQLFNPLLVGIIWRRWAAEASSERGTDEILESTTTGDFL